MLFIKYEDLAKNPEPEMRKIYQYFDLPYFSHDFDNIEQITQEDDSVYGIYGDHKIRKKLEPLRSDYKEVLGQEACNWIKNKYRWFYDEFKYY
jgi:sulfotransferase